MRFISSSRPREGECKRTSLPRQAAAAFVCLALAACAGKTPTLPLPVGRPPAAELELSLFLVGDGGHPRRGGEPVLQALTAELEAAEAPAAVVFLGDNIYPAGLPPVTSGARAEMERRLKDQIDAVAVTEARAVFVPGNHDWDFGGRDGWNAVRRQAAFIAAHGENGRIVHLPEDGCPGPSVLDVGDRLRLIVLDTHWWLHSHDKPGPAECAFGTEDAVVDGVKEALATRGERHAVVVAHHPLVSSGPHGGFFGWQDHLFPLTRLWDPLWIPLPLVGSGHPLVRRLGISSQDASGGKNARMRAALEAAFEDDPPVVYAAGHEHTLEVLNGSSVPYLVVSGTGYFGHTSPTKWRGETLYRNPAAGFVRLDVARGGKLRLGVLTVDAEARLSEPYAVYLNAR